MQPQAQPPEHASPAASPEAVMDIDRLPLFWSWPLADVAQRFGNRVALKLADAFGGTNLYLPSRFDPDHPIAREAGDDVLSFLLRLPNVLPGSRLTMPNAARARLGILQARVADLLAEGLPTRDIALRLGIHIRKAQTLAAAVRQGTTAEAATPGTTQGKPSP